MYIITIIYLLKFHVKCNKHSIFSFGFNNLVNKNKELKDVYFQKIKNNYFFITISHVQLDFLLHKML